MLKAIYHPNHLPELFETALQVQKITTSDLNECFLYYGDEALKKAELFQNSNIGLLVRFPLTVFSSYEVTYTDEDLTTVTRGGKKIKDVVPLIMVMQNFQGYLYTVKTFIPYYSPEPAVKPNQLKLFPDV